MRMLNMTRSSLPVLMTWREAPGGMTTVVSGLTSASLPSITMRPEPLRMSHTTSPRMTVGRGFSSGFQ